MTRPLGKSRMPGLMALLFASAGISAAQPPRKEDQVWVDELDSDELPTRLSSIRGDKGYKSDAKLAQYRVLFNDVEQFDCEVADVTDGYIKRVTVRKHSHTGRQQVMRTDKIFGKVEILLKD